MDTTRGDGQVARTRGHGNPDWTRGETILALDLYFSAETAQARHDPRVKDLSEFLRRPITRCKIGKGHSATPPAVF